MDFCPVQGHCFLRNSYLKNIECHQAPEACLSGQNCRLRHAVVASSVDRPILPVLTKGDKWSSAIPTNASLRAQVKSDMPLLSIIFFFLFLLFAKRYSTFAEEESMSPPCRRIETVAYALECCPAMLSVSCSCPCPCPYPIHVHVHVHVCFQMIFQTKVRIDLE